MDFRLNGINIWIGTFGKSIFLSVPIVSLALALCLSYQYVYFLLPAMGAYVLVAAVFRKCALYSVVCILITLLLLNEWPEIDMALNQTKYYKTFSPLMKNPCIASYDLASGKVSRSVFCKNTHLTNLEQHVIKNLDVQHNATVRHLKQMGCYSVNISDNYIQLWCKDEVFGLKMENHRVV